MFGEFRYFVWVLAFFLAIATLGTEYVKPITGGGDKLLFLKGKVPEHITLPWKRKKKISNLVVIVIQLPLPMASFHKASWKKRQLLPMMD